MTVSVLGAGAFGTALAIALSSRSDVMLWARNHAQMRDMLQSRENATRLPGITLPDMVHPVSDMAAAASNDIVLVAVPMQELAAFLQTHSAALAGRHLVACCKGIDLKSLEGAVTVIRSTVPDAIPALLTGPGFAAEIAAGLPTAMTLACSDSGAGKRLQQALSTESLRLYRTTDVRGAELGGALKNVMAIACGATIGAGLGSSARAALMTRGYAEMLRMADALGARRETLAGLSGLGDLVLTCSSDLSRNYRLGLSIGRGETFDPSITVEGAATAQAVGRIADAQGIDMPITRAVINLVAGKQTLKQAISNLLARSLKEEG